VHYQRKGQYSMTNKPAIGIIYQRIRH